MGQSTDGIIFYGYTWGDEEDLFDGEDYEDFLRQRAGIINPWAAMPDFRSTLRTYAEWSKAEDDWSKEHKDEIDAYFKASRGLEAEFAPVELHSHCSCEYPIPYLSTFRLEASRGYPVKIESLGTADLIIEWDDALDKWFTELGIEKPHDEPGFYLASMWC